MGKKNRIVILGYDKTNDTMKLDEIKKLNDKLTYIYGVNCRILEILEGTRIHVKPKEVIPLKDFCKAYKISRQTAHKWAYDKIILTEKVGGKIYVLPDSIKTNGSLISWD